MATATKFEQLDAEVSIIAVVAMLEAARLCQNVTNHVLMLMPPIEHYRDLRAAVVAWAVQRNLDVRISTDGSIKSVRVLDGARTIVTLQAIDGAVQS
jgi:hypothetical protein